MGFWLKEALKCLCSENQWSYAVFWKIGCRNPTLLVWEECHYEPARYSSLLGISGLESTEALLKEWEGLESFPETQLYRLGCQVEDRVCSLIKMMMNNQVHVFGQGIVGRAALTGNHLWILRENHMGEGHPSEVMAEVNRQFSSGMQTVTVIPVLPHGVVQLASASAVMENMGFVNNVKALFAQLGSVPGALLSNNYVKKDPCQKIGVPISLRVPVLADQTICTMENFALLVDDSFNQEILTSQASGLARQSSPSLIAQNQDNMQANTSTLQTTSSLTLSTSKSLNDLVQATALPLMKSNVPLTSRQAASTGFEVFPSNSGGQFSMQSSPYDPCSGLGHQSTLGPSSTSCSGLTFMEQQVLSGKELQGPVNHGLPASSTIVTEVRTVKAGVSNYLKDSVIASLLGGSELPNAGSGLQALASVPCSCSIPCRSADSNSHCIPQEGSGPQSNSSDTKAVSLSTHADQSNKSDMLLGGSHQSHFSTDGKHAQTEFSATEHGVGKGLFQAFTIPPGNQDDYISRSGTMSSIIQDCLVASQECARGTTTQPVCEDACVQHSSGEDLFDILGLDFKSKLLCGTGSQFLMPASDESVQSLGTDVSTCLTQMDAGSDFYATKDGISESGIFSEAGTDHLLDAVVSKVHTTSKQNFDDNVSCRTTVTKLSSSSVISDAPTYGHVSVSDQMKIDMFGLPPPPSKVEIARSSSFKSGCSVDNAGGSQTNPIYRSQISLWMEDGQNSNQEHSISTANSKRPDETGKANRKRLRPGESPRPRPKDRQMIQDRVKELREIVPNGAKCSIDALLERTIKHMLFLQSVTKHADKLKQSRESKIFSKEDGLLMKDNFEGGATWAYEVGSQSMIYPIIVEDLNAPRQMLVEMLCEERGSFLEIADIIRGLGLTILKGVMEVRNDKVWAHFAVEANRDVSRMDIFISLVHLLEQSGKGGSPALKGIDSGSLMVHNTFNQASIPATGLCNSLQ